jgi:hypothetical protein
MRGRSVRASSWPAQRQHLDVVLAADMVGNLLGKARFVSSVR